MNKLQNLIRKLKNPSMVYFSCDPGQVPKSYLMDGRDYVDGYCAYTKDLLTALKGVVPAVRFSFGSFAILGGDALSALGELLHLAHRLEYYTLLDVPEFFSGRQAELYADCLMNKGGRWEFDGLLLPCYLGSDALRPFADKLKEADRDIFVTVRTANKSASELQDLLTGSRLVWTAAADTTKRLGESTLARSGYSRVGIVGPATSADTLAVMRSKYPSLFLLIDGFDYSGANAKNCAGAFDNLGHGAVACAGDYILSAWKETELYDPNPVELAVQAAERMKKNLNRYVTIL